MSKQYKIEAEGGCGVIGCASATKIAGRHLLPALCQMENRGNGKGGGIAAVGLDPAFFGVSQDILEQDFLLAIAYIDIKSRTEVENECIKPTFHIDHTFAFPHLESSNEYGIAPPEVVVYFVRVKDKSQNEEEIVYRNSYQLNQRYYNATGKMQAFVLSHGKNLLVLKMVGYGQDVIRYYKLENFVAHVWIGHHRYPTKGRVWHPGGAHPFIGLQEALVHNGDFANYFSICEYLKQRDIHPLFLTDTEVAALLFDLLHRTYKYPLEYVIEALAPTTERDFALLPEDKKNIYRLIQKTHIHGSPDGPWFFLIAQSIPQKLAYRLIGITDTSMLRPQVFALSTGEIPIGFAASEKQAIDATLKSLSVEDSRFWPCADYYWNARGGSHTDGGAFSFTVTKHKNGNTTLICEDKFEKCLFSEKLNPPYKPSNEKTNVYIPKNENAETIFRAVKEQIVHWNYSQVTGLLFSLHSLDTAKAITLLTFLMDRPYPIGSLRKSSLNALWNSELTKILQKAKLPETCIIDASTFPSEGENSLSRHIVEQYQSGCKKFILFNCKGQRFIGCGLGPNANNVEIHIYGSSGDYLASGIHGATIHVHGNAQDQVGQIMQGGSLVIFGDVGQTFMYGANGGNAFVLGNTAGRPMINTVGNPRVVINGTCLDYLAESFMAGDPLKRGGFVIVNALKVEVDGRITDLDIPYPGGNLLSLASGGAAYIRDPYHKVVHGQLNGCEFVEMSDLDWDLVLPYLEENEHHFSIPVERLLEMDGKVYSFEQMYRKIRPIHAAAVLDEEAWVKGK